MALPISMSRASSLEHLGRTVMYSNSDSAVLYINLWKYHRRWGMLEKVLGKTGISIKAWAIMYKVSVQEVHLYRSEIRVVTDAMMTVLEGFHHRISILIA